MNLPAVAAAPAVQEGIARAQLITGGEEEKGSAHAVRNVKLPQCFLHRMSAVMISRDGQHTERLPAEVPLVLLGGVGREIGAHLPLEACLSDIAADNRHGAAIDLDHEATEGAIGQHETKDQIGHKADVMERALVRDLHP